MENCPDLGPSIEPKSSLLLSSLLNRCTLVLALYCLLLILTPPICLWGKDLSMSLRAPCTLRGVLPGKETFDRKGGRGSLLFKVILGVEVAGFMCRCFANRLFSTIISLNISASGNPLNLQVVGS